MGWWRPAVAVLAAMVVPTLLSVALILFGAPTISGPPKGGTGFTLADHMALTLAALTASVIVSWMLAPVALLLLRAAAMLGWAGWGSAVLAAWALGLPMVHFALHGDVTSEEPQFLPAILAAIAILGLTVWVIFWALMRKMEKVDPVLR